MADGEWRMAEGIAPSRLGPGPNYATLAGMSRRSAVTLLLVVLWSVVTGCGTIVDTLDPPRPPEQGDLKNATAIRSRIQALIGSGAMDPAASLVTLDGSGLAAWTQRSVAITPEMYPSVGSASRSRGQYGLPPGMPENDLGITCKHDLDRPYVYLHYNVRGQFLEQKGNDIALSSGSCTTLEQGKNTARIGLYGFAGPFLNAVPAAERTARATRAAGWFDFSIRGTDDQVSELGGMLVAERAGYVYETMPGLFHTSSERIRGNFYHLVVIGDRTMISILVKGPRGVSVPELQAIAQPLLESVRTTKTR